MTTNPDVVRQYFAAYVSKDREALERLLADDFTFTSPLHDRIGRERYFERCWPNSAQVAAIRIEKLFVEGDGAFVQYELEPKDRPAFRNANYFTFRDGKVLHLDVYFGADPGEVVGEGEIRAVVEDWAAAISRKDAAGVAAHFALDSVRFYIAPPLQHDHPLEETLETWFATFQGRIGYEIRDLTVVMAANLAYCHSFNRITGKRGDGKLADIWFRETLCLRQFDGRWLITHAHESVPFLMDGSDKAAMELNP